MGKKLTLIIIIFSQYFTIANAQITFDDGGVHYVDYEINDNVLVRSGNLRPTTLNVMSNGRIIGLLGVKELSIVNISGGIIEDTFSVSDRSKVNISDGILNGRLHVKSPYVEVIGGTINKNIECYGTGGVNISGGELTAWLRMSNDSIGTISGGIIQAVRAHENSQLNISGGLFIDSIVATNDTVLDITGGLFGGTIDVRYNAVITISGTGFNYPYGEISDITGILAGTLDSGEAINNNFSISHYGPGYDGAKIVLTPEPTTLLLLGLGAVLLRRKC